MVSIIAGVGIFALSIAALFVAVFLSIVYRYKHIPGPPPKFPIGNLDLLGLTRPEGLKDLTTVYHDLSKTYGGVVTFFVCCMPVVAVEDPDVARELMVSKFRIFHDRPDMTTRDLVSGSRHRLQSYGILTAQGQTWTSVRAAVQPVFHSTSLSQYAEVMNTQATDLLELLAKKAETGAFDVMPVLAMVAMQVVFKCVFGITLQGQDDPAARNIMQAARSIVEEPIVGNRITMVTQLLPVPVHQFIGQALRRLGFGARGEEMRDVMYGLTCQLIAKYFQANPEVERWDGDPDIVAEVRPHTKTLMPEDAVPSNNSVLASLLRAKNKETGQKLDREVVMAQGIPFVIAGFETTATALSFSIYLLSTHPEAELQLLEEIDAQGRDATPTYETMGQWPYAMAVFRETLRLYPVGAIAIRKAQQAATIGKHTIPKGAQVHINIWGMHRNEEYFPEPEVFRPERFIENPDLAKHKAYMPFGAGPHNCVGYRFALEEALILLVRMYQRFTFRLSTLHHPDNQLKTKLGITLAPVNGLWVTPISR